MTLKANHHASTISHAEDCIYEVLTYIKKEGSEEQLKLALDALQELEQLYHSLREDE
jgi:hypothetical protein